MQKGHCLQFDCHGCHQPVRFSVFELERSRNDLLMCSLCGKKYHFDDENLRRQLKKFEMLCRQIVESEEILAHTAVGVDIGDRHVKIPYRLLLTRFNSSLELNIGNSASKIEFRFEPLQDMPKNLIDEFEEPVPGETNPLPYLLPKD